MCSANETTCSRLAEKDAEIQRLKVRVAALEKALFGPRSERLSGPSPEHPGQQVFEDLLKELDELNGQLGENEPPEPPKQDRTARGKSKRRSLEELVADADLPVETVEVEPPEAMRFDPVTGEPLKRVEGHRTVRLAYRPGGYV
ncbi:MAG: hypothetical protein RQ723_13470, partial [Desulfuromonadales bacterium]|nr:hypothetical protein [Desulfuromonadales bacterium]